MVVWEFKQQKIRKEHREIEKVQGEDVRKHNSDQITQCSREGRVKWSVSVSLTLFTLAKNLTYNPKLNMIPPPLLPPPSSSGNKSCCNYQTGSITVTSLLSSARLSHLQLTLTCSSLAVHRYDRRVGRCFRPHTHKRVQEHSLKAAHTEGWIHADVDTHSHKYERWTPRGAGHRSQLLLETSLQLSNQQRVTILSQNSSLSPLSNEMKDKDENHMVSHAMWTCRVCQGAWVCEHVHRCGFHA